MVETTRAPAVSPIVRETFLVCRSDAIQEAIEFRLDVVIVRVGHEELCNISLSRTKIRKTVRISLKRQRWMFLSTLCRRTNFDSQELLFAFLGFLFAARLGQSSGVGTKAHEKIKPGLGQYLSYGRQVTNIHLNRLITPCGIDSNDATIQSSSSSKVRGWEGQEKKTEAGKKQS
jgi:hypothetical protein